MDITQWIPKFTKYPDLSGASIADLVNLAKTDPILADYLWLPNSPPLFPLQKIDIRAINDHFLIFKQAIRGGAKSWDVARALTGLGLTHSLKIGYTAPTYRQAMLAFNYTDDFFQQNWDSSLPLSLSREQDGQTVRGSMEATLYCKNGTVHKALPMGNGEKLRGERFDILYCDEFFLMEREMFMSHLMPFLLGHRDPNAFGRKLIITTSAEYEDSFAYSFLTKTVIPKIIEEDRAVEADPEFKRTTIVIDTNLDDLRAEGYQVNPDVLNIILNGATEEEREKALNNKWVGTSGQFFPSNLADRMASPHVHIEHRAIPGSPYVFSIDVARQLNGDFFVLDVFKMLGNRRMAQVNSHWEKGLTADEMAVRIMDFDDRFNPQWIVMDKGGGGLFVRDSLMKNVLEMKDGKQIPVKTKILEHNEFGMQSGDRKLIFNRATDEKVREALAGFRSRGGEYISTEDVLIHLIHDGMKQLFLMDECPLLIPSEYTDEGGDYESNAVIFDRIRTGIYQLRHLAMEFKESFDGSKEIVRTKVSKVPKYVWKSGDKDGASAFIYGFIAYALYYRDDTPDDMAMPIVQPSNLMQMPGFGTMVDAYPDQKFRF